MAERLEQPRFRARLILALAEGQSYREIARGMRTSAATIARWRTRFEQDRLAGLEGRHKGSTTPYRYARSAGAGGAAGATEAARRNHALVVP